MSRIVSQDVSSLPIGPAAMVFLAMSLLGFMGVYGYFSEDDWFLGESILSMLMLLFFVILLVTALTRNKFLLILVPAAFFLKVSVAFFIYDFLYESYGFRGFEGNDDLYWNAYARSVYLGRMDWLDVLNKLFSPAYILFVSAIYSFADYNPINPRLVNAALGSLVIIPAYYITFEIFKNRQLAQKVVWWVALFPALIIWSGSFHKDVSICFFMTLGVYACVRLFKRGFGLTTLMLLLSSIGVLLLLRVFAGHSLILLGMLSLIYRSKVQSRLSGTFGSLLVAGLAVALLAFVALNAGRQDILDIEQQYLSRLQNFEQSSSALASSQYGSGVSAVLTNAPRFVRLIVGPVITLIAPVPPGWIWDHNYTHSALSTFQPLQLLLLPYFMLALYLVVFSPSIRQTGLVLLAIPVLIALLANSFYAVGQISKYRLMVEPLLLILAAWVFYTSSKNQRRNYFLISAFMTMGAVASYLILKFIF